MAPLVILLSRNVTKEQPNDLLAKAELPIRIVLIGIAIGITLVHREFQKHNKPSHELTTCSNQHLAV
jgi:hypothetical protein